MGNQPSINDVDAKIRADIDAKIAKAKADADAKAKATPQPASASSTDSVPASVTARALPAGMYCPACPVCPSTSQ